MKHRHSASGAPQAKLADGEGLFVGMWCLELQTLQGLVAHTEKFSELSELCVDVASLPSLREKNKRGGGNATSEE